MTRLLFGCFFLLHFGLQAVPVPEEKPRFSKIPTPSQKPRLFNKKNLMPKRAGKFSWPYKGKVTHKFKKRINGVVIQARSKAPVKASENGVIAFVGRQIKGLGHVVLIRHSDRWVSTYAKLGKTTVQAGQTVRQGQVIGYTPETKRAKLFFELRHLSIPKDPMKFLR